MLTYQGIPIDVIQAKKPQMCMGCGLPACDGHRPAPHETDWDLERVTPTAGLGYRCIRCRTRTFIPLVDTTHLVECRTCGRDIPESLQGAHVCESHPLGLAAEYTATHTGLDEHR